MSKELRELFNKLKNLQDQAGSLVNKEGVTATEINEKTEEIKTVKAKIEAQKLIDEGEIFDENGTKIVNGEVEPKPVNKSKNNDDEFRKIHVRAFAKAIAKKPLSGEEIKALSSNTDADGGYLIPQDILTQINLLSREYVSLRNEVNTIPVTTKEGSRIIEVDAARTGFTDISELTELPNLNSPQWTKVDYKIRDLGGLLPIPNSLLADETGGLVNYLATWFVQKSYATDNQMILFDDGSKGSQGAIGTSKLAADILSTDNVFVKEVLTAVVTFEEMKSIINKGFPNPITKTLKIITNQSGLDILDNMEDKNGRPYLTGSGTDDFPYMFKGRAVTVYDDKTLPNDVTTPANPLVPFLIGDMKKGMVLWDRQQMSVASSTEAGFVNNSTIMRGIVRQDTRVWDNKAVKIIYSPLSAAV